MSRVPSIPGSELAPSLADWLELLRLFGLLVEIKILRYRFELRRFPRGG